MILALRERERAAREKVARLRDAPAAQLKQELAERIRFCLQIINRQVPELDELSVKSIDELRVEVDRCEADLIQNFKIG